MLVVLIMEMKIEKINNLYQTADMACAAALSIFFPIEAVNRTSGRRFFEEMQMQIFWRGERAPESMRACPTLPSAQAISLPI